MIIFCLQASDQENAITINDKGEKVFHVCAMKYKWKQKGKEIVLRKLASA